MSDTTLNRIPARMIIPDAERGLHASGHACGPDLLKVAREIAPDILLPVHSENAEFYTEQLAGEKKISGGWPASPI